MSRFVQFPIQLFGSGAVHGRLQRTRSISTFGNGPKIFSYCYALEFSYFVDDSDDTLTYRLYLEVCT